MNWQRRWTGRGIGPGLTAVRREVVATGALLAVLGWGSASEQEAQRGLAAFVGVSVVTMENERVLSNQTVVVRDGRIAEIGPARRVAVPGGAIRIEGAGRYLIPGLADMHVHFTAPG